MSMSGRRVLITGGGSGLGADLARGFAAAGASVVVTGRRREPLERVAMATGGSLVVGDVTVEADVVRMFAEAGDVDIVVANAGAAASAPLTRTTSEIWHRMIDVNLTGAFLTLREGSRQLGGRGWGRLITIASTAGLHGFAYVSAYTAAKHGAVGLTRAVAAEVAGTGVTANALCPGYLATEMTDRTVENIMAKTGRSRDEATASLAAANHGGRLIDPAEVTAVALRLCGPGSESINGESIEIDGGTT